MTILSAGSGFSKWVGYVGVFAALIGLVAMFRNVTPQVALIAEVNNYLLPIWMINFGVALTRRGRSYLEEEP